MKSRANVDDLLAGIQKYEIPLIPGIFTEDQPEESAPVAKKKEWDAARQEKIVTMNRENAEHATDFDTPIYNIWKQQTKSEGSSHFFWKGSRMNLSKLQSDPAAFRNALMIDADGKSVSFADVCEPWQRTDFEALDPAWMRVAGLDAEPQFKRCWIERPRGHSKSTDEAIMTAWVLFSARQKITGAICASDKDQGKIIRDSIEKIVRLNAWLGSILDVQQWRVVNKITGSEVEIISSDVGSSFGIQPSFVICDEVCHWARSDLWESLFSSAAKRPSCVLVVLTNAGFGESWQWSLRESVRNRDDWYFSRLDGPQASWITSDILAEQRALLPDIAYRRLWLNEWSSGSGDAFSTDDISAAFSLSGPLAWPELGWQYCCGLDLGLRHDSTAFAVIGKHVGHIERKPAESKPVRSSAMRALIDLDAIDAEPDEADEVTFHPGSGRLKLAALRIWTPQRGTTVDLPAVESTVGELAKRFRAAIGFDPYQAIQMSQNLRRFGIPVEEIAFSGENLKSMASETLNSFQDRRIDLFPSPDLEADLKSIRIVEKSYGFRLEASRKIGAGTRHADTVTALSIALHLGKYIRSDSNALASRSPVLYCPS